jgi:hypothetical protein
VAPIEIIESVSPDEIVFRPCALGRRFFEELAFGIADPFLVNDALAIFRHGGGPKKTNV